MKLLHIREIDSIKMAAIAKCHCAAFPEALSAALGIKFVAKMLSWYVSTPKGILILLEDGNGNCAGYCSGLYKDGSSSTGASSGMAQHSIAAAIFAFINRPQVLFHKELYQKWPLIWQNIRLRFRLSSNVETSASLNAEMSANPYVALASIAVHPEYQSLGVGTRLLEAFEQYALEHLKVTKIQLSVRKENDKAIQFYSRNGYLPAQNNGKSIIMAKYR
jgi:GNAT superfamily N-acetyltransferase